MSDLTLTIRLSTVLPWLYAYLAVGVALYPLLAWGARRTLQPHDRKPFVEYLLPGWRRWYVLPAVVLAWPLAMWEELR